MAAALVTAFITAGLSCQKKPERPSILLVTLDTTRADYLCCYGDTSARTPTLDSLALHGIRFTQVVTPVPLTCPSHTSMLTGVNPDRHGIQDNGAFVLPASQPLVQEQLQAAGYRTGAFLSSYVLDHRFGLARGFETYDDNFFTERIGFRTARAAERWIDELPPGHPFFLWVHFYDPHEPWRAPEPYRSMPLRNGYAQEIAAMDAALGSLLGHLRERRLLENTLVLAAADHGEGLGDHGEKEHGIFLYDETLRVPFIVCLPGGGTGRVSDAPGSLIDIAPTLLDVAGLQPLPDIEGASLLPVLRGGSRPQRRAEYSETLYPERAFFHSPLRSLRTLRWKYIRAPRPELYDLKNDPGERQNLWAQQPDTAAWFEGRLARYLASIPREQAEPAQMSQQDLERLQSLGYLSSGNAPEPEGEDLPDPKDMIPDLDLYSKAQKAFAEERWRDAAPLLREVLRLNPQNLVAVEHLGQALSRLGRPEEAIAVLQPGLRIAPKNALLARYLATALRQAGRPADAIDAYKVMLNRPGEEHWSGVLGTAGCLVEMGRSDEAIACLQKEAGPGPFKAISGRMVDRIRRYIELKKMQKPGPDGDRLRLDLAGAAFDLGLFPEVRRILAFHSASSYVEASRHRILASVAGHLEDHAASLAEFELARKGLPNDPYILSHLAPLYLEAGRPEDAVEATRGVIRLGRPSAADFYNKACAHALLSQPDSALAALETAVRLGYAHAAKLAEDPDLASLRDNERFRQIAARAVER